MPATLMMSASLIVDSSAINLVILLFDDFCANGCVE